MNSLSGQSARWVPITGRVLHRGLRLNIIAGTLGVSWWTMTQGMPLTMFLEALGASGLLMGLATTIMQFAFLMQVPATLFAERLKARKPELKVVAVEPAECAVLSGGKAGAHKIQGIGPGFVPAVLRRDLIDEVLPISSQDAFDTSRRLMREEGLVAGMSSGANVAAALQVAQRPENAGKLIVTLLCDIGERHIYAGLFQ